MVECKAICRDLGTEMTPEKRAALCDGCYRNVPLNAVGSHHTTRDNERLSWGEWPCAAFSVHNLIVVAIAEEREASAKLAEQWDECQDCRTHLHIAAAIRART